MTRTPATVGNRRDGCARGGRPSPGSVGPPQGVGAGGQGRGRAGVTRWQRFLRRLLSGSRRQQARRVLHGMTTTRPGPETWRATSTTGWSKLARTPRRDVPGKLRRPIARSSPPSPETPTRITGSAAISITVATSMARLAPTARARARPRARTTHTSVSAGSILRANARPGSATDQVTTTGASTLRVHKDSCEDTILLNRPQVWVNLRSSSASGSRFARPPTPGQGR